MGISRRQFVSGLSSTFALGAFGGTAASACSAAAKKGPLVVTFTFDDSTVDHMIAAAELEKRGWRGSFNIIAGWIGRKGSTGRMGEQLTWDQCRDLLKRGHQVNSHTVNHVNLKKLLAAGKADEVRKEVAESRDRITKELGVKPKYLTHPFVAMTKETDRIIFSEGLIPMTDLRINFGGGDNDPDGPNSLGCKIDEWCDKGVLARDLMFHGIDPQVGLWRPFKTVDDFARTLDQLKEREQKGMVKVVNYDDFYAFAQIHNLVLKI